MRLPSFLGLLCLFPLTVGAACPITGGLPPQMQADLLNGLYEEGIHLSAFAEDAACTLRETPDHPNRDILRYRLADAYQRLGNTEQALETYQAFLRAQPEDATLRRQALMEVLELQMARKQYDEVLTTSDQLLAAEPEPAQAARAWFLSGKSRYLQAAQTEKAEWYQEAIQRLEQARPLEADPQQERQTLLGWAWYALDNPTFAEQAWRAELNTLENDPEAASRLFGLAVKQEQQQRPQQAIRLYEELTTRHPEAPEAVKASFRKAETRYRATLSQSGTQGIPPEASDQLVADYEAYLATGDAEFASTAQLRLGTLRELRGELGSALAAYEAYLTSEAGRNDEALRFRVAHLYRKNEQPQQALKQFQAYLESGAPEHRADAFYAIGVLQQEQGNTPAAITAYEQAREDTAYQNRPELRQLLLGLYLQVGDSAGQQRLLEEQATADNASVEDRQQSQFQLITLLHQRDDCTGVLKRLTDLPDDHPQRAELLFMRGDCHFRQKQWEPAVADLLPLRGQAPHARESFRMRLTAFRELERWVDVAEEMRLALEQKADVLTGDDFRLWIEALKKTEQWEQADATYQFWQRLAPVTFSNPQLLLEWTEVLERLDQPERLERHYKDLLRIAEKPEVQKDIIRRLAGLYSQSGRYDLLAQLYEYELLPLQKTEEEQRQTYYTLAELCLEQLTASGCAEIWLKKTDAGGTSELELSAAWTLSQLEERAGQNDAALKRLQDLASRPLPELWAARVHFRVGVLHQKKMQWTEAVAAYEKVVATQVKTEPAPELRKEAEAQLQAIQQNQSDQELQALIDQQDWPGVTARLRADFQSGKRERTPTSTRLLLDAEIQSENWEGVSETIRTEVEAGRMKLDEALLQTLVFAENQKTGKARSEGVLGAYALFEEKNPEQAGTVPMLLEQAQAAESLGGRRKAKALYEQALEKTGAEDLPLSLSIGAQLERLYEDEGYTQGKAELYDTLYRLLEKESGQANTRRGYAVKLAMLLQSEFKRNDLALEWYGKADEGGVSDQELFGVLSAAALESQMEKLDAARRRLQEASRRDLPQTSPYYVQLHFQLAQVLQMQEQWQPALEQYQRVLQAPESAVNQSYQANAGQRAKEIESYLNELKKTAPEKS